MYQNGWWRWRMVCIIQFSDKLKLERLLAVDLTEYYT